MAFTEFYCDPVNGSNLNAGSTNAAPLYTGVGDSDGTSVFTPSDGSTPASTVSVGMFASIYVTIGATVAVFIGRITAVAAGVNGAITVSTTAKSGTIPTASAGAHTITCKVGGYWKGPNAAVGFPFSFIATTLTDSGGDYPRVNLLNTATYNITAGITHSLNGPIFFQGMTATPGDLGRATIDGGVSGASYTLLSTSGLRVYVRDMILQNNGLTGNNQGTFFATNGSINLERVTVNNVRGAGFWFNAASNALECEAYACDKASVGDGGFRIGGSAYLVRCLSHDNSGTTSLGFNINSSNEEVALIGCVADTNGLHGVSISALTWAQIVIENLTSYGNVLGAGVVVSGGSAEVLIENSLLANNGTYGVNHSATGDLVRLSNNVYYTNTSGQTNGATDETGAITCSVQPMTDPANGDFSLNNTAGGGASCRNAGRGKFVQNAGSYSKTTTAFPDVGAAQHQDAGGGAGGTPVLQSAIIQGLGAI